ncbi:hypothetical protein Rhopal_005947-T1 [Rhodotorula paludigena]|uniref:Uncharacterized protein n=1 Tax=Rhodotorula paludigena TaxID=86838 RepID=A0AAV5GTR5_9BASI|nr:hypothetical protein Rhopal_005947-T1 [Rhodotorula paludigena]
MSDSLESAPAALAAVSVVPRSTHLIASGLPSLAHLVSDRVQGPTTGQETLEKGSHHRYRGNSDAKELSDLDCQRMHAEDARDAKAKLAHDEAHHFDGQPEEQRDRAKGILRDPHSPADAKLNALDNSEALPHGGYLRGDL